MTNPVFLAEQIPDDARSWTLDGEEAHHARVLRLAPGEGIDVVDGRGTRLRGTVRAVLGDAVQIDVLSVTHEGDDAEIVLVQALAKGGRDEDAIEMATEVGADAVVPWQAERSIAQWPPARAARSAARWEARLRAAAKQSRRSRVPALLPLHDSRALARFVAETAAAGGAALVLHEAADAPLHRVDLPTTGRVLLVVGPEGGITPRELEAFTAAGAVAVVAGPHVMRSGTAGPVAVSHVARALGRWDAAGTMEESAPERPA
ncbi:MAG: 16S rRNA (uracil(1498)-N(3))-methyltransferase [Actinobacteria bacterium]|nr:16S rRNA (uracil(1498)-N(3))-methyltransferase [Actinomycetota bacterium]